MLPSALRTLIDATWLDWPPAFFTLQVALLRERSIWYPTYSLLPLRRSVLHVLAAGGSLSCCPTHVGAFQ